MANTLEISPDVISLIPAKKAFEKRIIPICLEGDSLLIGVTDKNDYKTIDDIRFFSGYKVKTKEFPPDLIISKLKEIYNTEVNNNSNDSFKDDIIIENSTIDFVNQIITSAIKSNASDIHFEVFENIFRIRYRIDGFLREILTLQKEKSPAITSRLKIMANLDISEKRRPQDGKIRFLYQNSYIDIRISTIPTNFGEKIVLRILNQNHVELELSKLGLNDNQIAIFNKNINLPFGMVLVTGPTGSGKTTTLYSALKSIHSIDKNILTVEDPIEYNLEGINQCGVKPDIGFDFSSALRSFLRQDPDIIMVGEIRDKETAEIAVRASLTGHLVFSTLHTNDSISAVSRLIDMGVEPFLISSSVKLIIAQRLVRKLCSCKTQVKEKESDNILGVEPLFKKCGCDNCSYTGFKGREAIFELFNITGNIQNLILKKASYDELKKEALQSGFSSLRDAGIEKIKAGITNCDEVIRETIF